MTIIAALPAGKLHASTNTNKSTSTHKEKTKKRHKKKEFTHNIVVESAGKLGNKRDIGDGKILVPLWQNNTGNKFVFTDLRGRFDNFGSSEYNIGIGYRQIIDYDFLD